jgi:hypothetical protein
MSPLWPLGSTSDRQNGAAQKQDVFIDGPRYGVRISANQYSASCTGVIIVMLVEDSFDGLWIRYTGSVTHLYETRPLAVPAGEIVLH